MFKYYKFKSSILKEVFFNIKIWIMNSPEKMEDMTSLGLQFSLEKLEEAE